MKIRTLTAVGALAAAVTLTGSTLATAAPGLPIPGGLDFGSVDVFGSLGLAGPNSEHGLEAVDNFRDVAGPGYVNEDGQALNPGVFYRSNAPLKPTAADKAHLSELGITHSYDMRHGDEITDQYVGGQVDLPTGIDYVHAEIGFANLMELAYQLQTPDDAREYMEDTNRRFVTEQDRLDGFNMVLTGLAVNGDPQMFHCTSGKDRTGWVSYLLLSIAGVDEETIFSDYLLSNETLAADNAKTLGMVGMAGLDPDVFAPLLGVERSYLEAGIDELHTRFDDVEDYLTSAAGLGLDQDTVDALRTKLVG